MTVELTWLVYACVFTVLMWVPYILNLIAVRGLTQAVGYPRPTRSRWRPGRSA